MDCTRALQNEIVDLIFTSVNLRHKNKMEITLETPLMGDGLGLDSLDILEIVVAVEKKYQIKIESAEQGNEIFKNIGSLTNFVANYKKQS